MKAIETGDELRVTQRVQVDEGIYLEQGDYVTVFNVLMLPREHQLFEVESEQYPGQLFVLAPQHVEVH